MSGSDRLVGEQVGGCTAKNGSSQLSTLHLEYSKWGIGFKERFKGILGNGIFWDISGYFRIFQFWILPLHYLNSFSRS